MPAFAIKEEAVAHLEKLKEAEPDWFCPLINGMCRKDCQCFAEPRLVTRSYGYGKDKTTTHDVYEHYCNNAMFTGSVCVENMPA